MIKLYKRDQDRTYYWEAWEHGDKVVFHWGILGERGETKEQHVGRFKSAQRIINGEAKKRQSEGYNEIPIDDHESLIVQYRTERWGSSKDLEKRHTVESLLNECLGWTGNGHCDGGDIGSGTINAYSFVVDPYLATGKIVETLRKAGLLAGAAIALQREDDLEVLWPEDYEGEFSYHYTSESPARGSDLTEENLATIVTLLRRIQEEGGSSNFVVFVADTEANYYIQFAGEAGESKLYAEAVSNEFLEPKFRLDRGQISLLRSLGWSTPSPDGINVHREWQATSDEDRLRIAHKVMKTFTEVYGLTTGQALDINLVFQ